MKSKNDIKLTIILLAVVGLFQSYGNGVLSYNFQIRHSFTEGFIYFIRPTFIFQSFTNIIYPVYAIGFIILVVMFTRKVKFKSFYFYFSFIVTVIYSLFGSLGSMFRFRDLLIPIMLMVVCENTNSCFNN
jgi:hypothetical protein